ncbi:DUF397 domain-containing protein [Streptomyces sp. NPDC048172]|uniref:DUF397 domain-containing protein n=1 Tax=Streptomyces sp. NPDC048172 TaxID=3365505 RepID=UPI0037216577
MTERNWQRASFCGGGGNNCVEVAAAAAGRVALRESERPERVLTMGPSLLGALIRHVKANPPE